MIYKIRDMVPARYLPLWSVLVLVLLLPSAFCKYDPETLKIRVVLFGEGWSVMPNIMMTDPKITAITIPAGDATYAAYMKKFMRIYMPRTYKEWLDKVDVFILSDLVPWGFTGTQLKWMRDSIEQAGTGMILSEMGWYGITGWTGNACDDWMKTPVYDAYPCDMVLNKENLVCPCIEVVHKGTFLNLPGIEQVAFADQQGLHVPRPGATTWALYKRGKEAAIITRPYGKGMTVANSMGLERFKQPYYEWKYYKDYFINHVYMAARVDIPQDLELVHSVRAGLESFRDRKTMILAMIDFIDKFKANTRPVEKMLADLEPVREKAEKLYLEQRYEESASLIDEAMKKFNEIDSLAVKLRDQALLWIYLIEWSAVSATSLLTGVLIWTLMVRRRLYREVGTTRESARRGLEVSR